MSNPQNNDGQNPNEDINAMNFISKASNPIVATFTIIFKIGAAISFLLLTIFISNDAIIMVVTMTCGAIDFWYTKNISGRILVGLRWWNILNPDTGEEKWIFESKNEGMSHSIINHNLFL